MLSKLKRMEPKTKECRDRTHKLIGRGFCRSNKGRHYSKATGIRKVVDPKEYQRIEDEIK